MRTSQFLRRWALPRGHFQPLRRSLPIPGSSLRPPLPSGFCPVDAEGRQERHLLFLGPFSTIPENLTKISFSDRFWTQAAKGRLSRDLRGERSTSSTENAGCWSRQAGRDPRPFAHSGIYVCVFISPCCAKYEACNTLTVAPPPPESSHSDISQHPLGRLQLSL